MANTMESEGNVHFDRSLISDPTRLTTQQLLREITSLKEVVFTRLDGMDRAIALSHENITRVPTDTDKQIGHLREVTSETFLLINEKFSSVQTQFAERDTRNEQSSRAAKVAVDAAFQASKEAGSEQNKSSSLAISKSETATNKQIEQLGVLIQTTDKSANDKFAEIRERLTRIESEGRGVKIAETTQQTSNISNVSIIGLVVSALLSIGAIVVTLLGRAG